MDRLPEPESQRDFEYFVIPSAEMTKNVLNNFELWASTPGAKGQARDRDNTIRTVQLPPRVEGNGWSIESFQGRWDLIVEAVDGPNEVPQ